MMYNKINVITCTKRAFKPSIIIGDLLMNEKPIEPQVKEIPPTNSLTNEFEDFTLEDILRFFCGIDA